MALLQYPQHRDGLPDPKGSLSFAIPAQAIARANQEVQVVAKKDVQVRERRKRGYNRYCPRDHVDTRRYTSQHSVDVTIHVKAVVIYFRGYPRPRKYFNTKIYPQNFVRKR